MRFSNTALEEHRDRVFASTPSVHVPLAGRAGERRALLDAVRDPEIRVFRLWAPVGAGKTFMLNNVWGSLTQSDSFDERRDYFRTTAGAVLSDALASAFAEREPGGRAVLAIEEFDRKRRFEPLVQAAERARRWLDETHLKHPLLVLTGDQFLTHPVFDEFFGDLPTASSTLDPLTGDLLTDALALRIDHAKGELSSVAEDGLTLIPTHQSHVDAMEILVDERVAGGLVPVTAPSVATFRDALSTLALLTRHFPPDDERIRIPGSLLTRLGLERPADGLAGELLAALTQVMRDEPLMRQLSVTDMAALARTSFDAPTGHTEEYEDENYYWEEAIVPLVHAGYLIPLGTPFLTSSSATDPLTPGKAIQGPYLPGPKSYRLAAA